MQGQSVQLCYLFHFLFVIQVLEQRRVTFQLVHLIVGKVFKHFLAGGQMLYFLQMLFEDFIVFFHVSEELGKPLGFGVIVYLNIVDINQTLVVDFREQTLSLLLILKLFHLIINKVLPVLQILQRVLIHFLQRMLNHFVTSIRQHHFMVIQKLADGRGYLYTVEPQSTCSHITFGSVYALAPIM